MSLLKYPSNCFNLPVREEGGSLTENEDEEIQGFRRERKKKMYAMLSRAGIIAVKCNTFPRT